MLPFEFLNYFQPKSSFSYQKDYQKKLRFEVNDKEKEKNKISNDEKNQELHQEIFLFQLEKSKMKMNQNSFFHPQKLNKLEFSLKKKIFKRIFSLMQIN